MNEKILVMPRDALGIVLI